MCRCYLVESICKMILLWFSLIGWCVCQGPPNDQQNEPESNSLDYVLNFDSPVYICSDAQSILFADTTGVTLTRYNETIAFLDGIIHFYGEVDTNTVLEILLDKEASGRYESVFSHEICDLCSEIGNPESDYHAYMKFFGLPDECPFGDGNYPINTFVMATDDLPVNGNNAGRYQATMNFYKDNGGDCKKDLEFLACMKLDLLIELGQAV